MPQSRNQPQFTHAFTRTHGEVVRADGSSVANDLVALGTHVGTHIDALSHASRDGAVHGDDPVVAPCTGGYLSRGVVTIVPVVGRALLLDAGAGHGGQCPAGHEITADELEHAAGAAVIGPGDALLIRTGWASVAETDIDRYRGAVGVPGVGLEGAHWLADRSPVVVGATRTERS